MIKEILVYGIVACCSLFLMTQVVPMMVGGLVSEETQAWLTIGLCSLVGCLIAAMAWDVVRRRRRAHRAAQGREGQDSAGR